MLGLDASSWMRICLVGLVVTLLATAAVSFARQRALQRTEAFFYTPLTGKASWEGGWALSKDGADPSQAGSLAGTDQVTIPFTGNHFALRVRRGPYRGYFWISVDDAPANRLPRTERGAYLVLSSPDSDPQVITIPVASDLEDGPHRAKIIADRGWGQQPLVGWRVEHGPDRMIYEHALIGLMGTAVVCLIGAMASGAWWSRRKDSEREQRQDGDESPEKLAMSLLDLPHPVSMLSSPISIIAIAVAFYASSWLPLTVLSGLLLIAIILCRLDLGLTLVMLSAPFYLHPRPLFGKSFSMTEIAVLICLLSWTVRLIPRLKLLSPASLFRTLSDLDLAVLFFILVAIPSTLSAEYSHVALRELRVIILEPALFYMILRTTEIDSKAIWRIIDGFVIGAVGVAVVGLTQYAFDVDVITAEAGFRRLRSVYGSPNNAALYLGRILPLLMAAGLIAAEQRRRIVYGLLAFPIAFAVLLSFSRGAILLGVPSSLLVLGFLVGGRWRWIMLGLVVAAAGVIVPLLISTPRFASLADPHSGTLFFRLQLWRSSWKMFYDHPFLGVGPDNFLYQYRGRYILPSAWQEPHLSHAHNIVLSYATRLGMLGLAAGNWLQFVFWRRALALQEAKNRDWRWLTLGLIGSMTYAIAHGLVDASYFFVDLAFAFLLTLGLVQWVKRIETNGQKDKS